MTPSSGTATATSQDRPRSSRSAMKIPPIIITGIEAMNIRPMLSTVWTCWTSLVLREIRVGAPKWESSLAEKSPTRWKTSRRRSRAMPAEVAEAKRAIATVARMLTIETPSMMAPARRMKSVSPLATPSSMIWPLSEGR